MPERRIPLHLVLGGLALFASAVATFVTACDDSTDLPPVPGADAGADTGREASSQPTDDGGADAGPKTTCELTRAYVEECGHGADLNCGTENYDVWCAANDKAINSDAFRRAEALCLTLDNCDIKKRRACEYEHYNDETPTASHKALVAAYCATCDPSHIAACTKSATTYDSAKGVESVGDIFIAWELADDVIDEMKTTCTGAGLADAGADAGADPVECGKAFGTCAADVYFAHLPDCPK